MRNLPILSYYLRYDITKMNLIIIVTKYIYRVCCSLWIKNLRWLCGQIILIDTQTKEKYLQKGEHSVCKKWKNERNRNFTTVGCSNASVAHSGLLYFSLPVKLLTGSCNNIGLSTKQWSRNSEHNSINFNSFSYFLLLLRGHIITWIGEGSYTRQVGYGYLVLNRCSIGSESTIAFTKFQDVAHKLSGCSFNKWATDAFKLIAQLTKIHSIYNLITLWSFRGNISSRQLICFLGLIRNC